jgi:hypothetical protein
LKKRKREKVLKKREDGKRKASRASANKKRKSIF